MDRFTFAILQSNSSDISDMVCDISILFKDIQILNRESASQSIQILTRIKEPNRIKLLTEYMMETGRKNAFVKIGFMSPGNNSVLIERAMYKYLRTLIMSMRTPNIMRYIMSFECKNFVSAVDYLNKTNPTPENTKMMETMENLHKEDYTLDLNHAIFMVLEKGLMCGPFYECMQTGNLYIKEVQAILFQVFYTLREMFIAKVRHNDLHLNNIWINTLPNPVRLIYFTDDNHYAVVETKYIVKIYDFDHSAFTNGAMVNSLLGGNLCARVGECSNPNERFDIHTVIYNLLIQFGNPKAKQKFVPATTLRERITNVAFDIIKNPILRTPDCCVHPGGICNKMPHPTIPGKTICDPNYQIAPYDVMNFKEMIATPSVFGGLMYTLSGQGKKRGFLEKDLPMKTLFTPHQIATYIPKNSFETNFFVSQDCTLSPLEMANKAFAVVDKMDIA